MQILNSNPCKGQTLVTLLQQRLFFLSSAQSQNLVRQVSLPPFLVHLPFVQQSYRDCFVLGILGLKLFLFIYSLMLLLCNILEFCTGRVFSGYLSASQPYMSLNSFICKMQIMQDLLHKFFLRIEVMYRRPLDQCLG